MAQETNDLEKQLRDMILSNVTIAHGQTSQDSQTWQPQRGRGRGRRGFTRASNRNYEPRAGHNPGQDSYQPGEPSPATRGGRNHFNNYPDARYRQHQIGPQHYSGPAAHHNGSTAQQGRQYASGPPIHTHNHNPTSSFELHTTSGGRPPRVLQRPFGAANVQGQEQINPTAPNHPHSHPPSYPFRPHMNQPRENPAIQADHLDHLALQEIPKVQMEASEYGEKEAFRKHLESIFQQAFAEGYSGDLATISLVSFGSLASGFAMPGSDMDLAVVPVWKDSSKADRVGIDRHIPRLFERAVLDAKMGGRLLTRTRVPILKVCQNPMDKLYTALVEERKKWDALPEEEQYPGQFSMQEPSSQLKSPAETDRGKPAGLNQCADSPNTGVEPTEKPSTETDSSKETLAPEETNGNATNSTTNKDQNHRAEKPWAREKILGPLDFPKTGVGIQCDINFENPLGVHNTHLLRCYSLCDPRVQAMVLFVKSWAKTRKINSSYSGTLSSYGWVLMVLHYLVNVAQPPVCPNLQHSIPQPTSGSDSNPDNFSKDTEISSYTVRFWRDEQAITQAAQSGQLTQNNQSVGALLRGFFQYYASVPSYGYGPRPPQFYWTTEVLSLRSPGGIITKQSKGWVSAKTIQTAEKKVTNRYLFAIEDPFEVDHNVARTVTHRGIVAIRDEFRRAWRILSAVGKASQPEGGLFDQVVENPLPSTPITTTTTTTTKAVGMESRPGETD